MMVAFLIVIYQKTLSPDHGVFSFFWPDGYCKFQPTCSEYGRQAVIKYGFFLGIIKAIWRFLRCNPWNPGGNDSP